MSTSIFLARLIGPTLLAVGAGMIVNREAYREMAREFLASRALIYLAGLLALVPGLAIVLTHNVWVADWRVLITLLGWLAVIGGVFRLLLPQQVTTIGTRMIAAQYGMTIVGAVVLVLGAVLTVYGFVR